MHKVAYPLICMTVASLLAGCGESATTQADAELAAAIDTAQQQYLRAVGAMGVLPETTDTDPQGAVGENPEVFEALADAEKTLTAALTANADAGRETRARAGQLLTDVHMAAADYHDLLMGRRSAAVAAAQARVADEAERVERLAARTEAMRTFVALSDGPDPDSARPKAAELKAGTVQRLADLDGRLASLREQAVQIDGRIDTLRALAQEKQTEAAALRRELPAATGMMRLELDERASALEAEVEKAEGEIAMEEVDREEIASAIDQLQVQRRTAEDLAASLDAWMNGLADRRAVIRAYAAELQDRLAVQAKDLATEADDLADRFAALLAEGEAVLAAADKAGSANTRATALLRQLQQEAQAAKREQAGSPMAPLLESMSSQGRLAAVTRQAGDVAMLKASVQHHLVQAHLDLVHLTRRVDGLCRQAGLSAPKRLIEIAEADEKIKTFAEQADQHYQAADKAFNDVAERMLTGAPVNTRTTEWIYRGAQARALYGRYRLAVLRNDAEAAGSHRQSASALVETLLQEHRGDPDYAPIEQIARSLGVD